MSVFPGARIESGAGMKLTLAISAANVMSWWTLRRVPVSEREASLFYYGFACRTIWPLMHLMLGRVSFDAEAWRASALPHHDDIGMTGGRRFRDNLARANARVHSTES